MEVTEQDLDAEEAYLKKRTAKEYVQKSRSKAQKKAHLDYDSSAADHNRDLRKRLIEQKHLNMEQVVTFEYEAWRLRTMGYRVYEIAEKMRTSESQVNLWLKDSLAAIQRSTKGLVELDKELELSRTEELIKHYFPLALMSHVMIERMRNGEPVPVEDFDQPQHATWIIIELIKMRCKIKGIVTTQADQSLVPAVDVFGWLRTQHEFIKEAAQDAPKDVLTLECDEPIDEPQSAHPPTAERLPDAL